MQFTISINYPFFLRCQNFANLPQCLMTKFIKNDSCILTLDERSFTKLLEYVNRSIFASNFSPLFSLHWHKFPRHATSLLWRSMTGTWGPIRTRKCGSTNWLIKVGLSPTKKNFFIYDGPSKKMKNDFYFILKTLSVLKIFKFLYWLFGHVEKTGWLERSG